MPHLLGLEVHSAGLTVAAMRPDQTIVLRPVDLHSAAREIVLANARNSGQVCNAVKRALVDREIFDAFVEAAQEVSKKALSS